MTGDFADLGLALADALAKPARAPFVAIHGRVPVVAPEHFARAARQATSFVFAPPDGPELATAGAVQLVEEPSKDGRWCTAASVLAGAESRVLGAARATPLQAFVALPFPSARPAEEPLERGLAVVPRWRYAVEDGEAAVTLVASEAELATESGRTRIVAEWQGIAARLSAPPAPAPLPSVVRRRAPVESYLAAVQDALAEFERGTLGKVVLSRQVELELGREPDALDLLEKLAREAGWGCRVAVQHEGASFVAVTPERLLRKRGDALETEALAGTADLASGAEISWRAKEAEEHAYVVRYLAETLRPLCAELAVPSSPGTRALRHVLHLHTPIRGRLAAPQHAFELAARLHPTPAVAGSPQRAALAWIDARETEPRGLYAGLVGWFDVAGDGDLWVGLRGATLRGKRLRQRVGGGLVAGSVAAEELAETEAKERALRRVLGALA